MSLRIEVVLSLQIEVVLSLRIEVVMSLQIEVVLSLPIGVCSCRRALNSDKICNVRSPFVATVADNNGLLFTCSQKRKDLLAYRLLALPKGITEV